MSEEKDKDKYEGGEDFPGEREDLGFFADKWEDVTLWWDCWKADAKLMGFWWPFGKLRDEIWHTLVGQWVTKITRVVQWIPVVWENCDWDYMYLMDMIEYKLKRMQKEIRGGMSVDEHKDERCGEIQEVLDLIEKIRENDWVTEEYKAPEEKYGSLKMKTFPAEKGCSRLEFYYSKTDLGSDINEQARKESSEIHRLAEEKEQEAYDKLFALMAKNIQKWWD